MPTMTVFFDKPFWVAVLEQHDADGCVRAVRHVFGAQPTDPELYEFLLRDGVTLLRRADSATPVEGRDATEALSADRRHRRAEAAQTRRERREAVAAERYAQRRAKAKAKHRGH
ncbi:YjdF family protein [Dactylosporangium sp. NPDC051541]|uniref:YjdF family protein n=1 Tax=Dactylosporangium sp. NPDC051541 TaxID=3363977 RepID=UPI0037AA7300